MRLGKDNLIRKIKDCFLTIEERKMYVGTLIIRYHLLMY